MACFQDFDENLPVLAHYFNWRLEQGVYSPITAKELRLNDDTKAALLRWSEKRRVAKKRVVKKKRGKLKKRKRVVTKKRRKLDRGSGFKGERNGVHFDQYERNEQDGTFYGEAQRRADRADEALYAKRRRCEKQRSAVDPKRQGYEDDGFVVPDEY